MMSKPDQIEIQLFVLCTVFIILGGAAIIWGIVV